VRGEVERFLLAKESVSDIQHIRRNVKSSIKYYAVRAVVRSAAGSGENRRARAFILEDQPLYEK